MSYYTWNGNEIIEHKKDCSYYLRGYQSDNLCVCNKDYYNCKDCKQYDKAMRYDYYERYENFIKGEITKFYNDELLDIIEDLNKNNINTLMVQQSIDKNEYYVKINNRKIKEGE